MTQTSQISKAYKHGSRWRCRVRTDSGWKWCPAADTPEEATAAAEQALQVALDPGAQDHPAQDAAAQDPGAPAGAAPEGPGPSKEAAAQGPGAPAAAGGVRIEGPYRHRGRWRCRIVSSSGRTWCAAGKTQAHAVAFAEKQAEEEARQGARSTRECIEQYLQDLGKRGIRPRSLDTFRHMLERFFGPALQEPLARIGTPHRAASLYDQLRTSVGQRTGKVLANDTHKNMLTTARTFLGWCVDRNWLKDNPLVRVKGIGHKRKGKPTLLVDSGRTFFLVALREAQAGDDGALAAIIGLTLGLRAGEVVSRLARDVDAGGTVLQVQNTPEYGWRLKTEQSKRALEIPVYLQPLLRARADGKAPTDLLFPSAVGRLQWPSWCNRQVARLSKLAGTPRVCMHSLRATAATLNVAAGASTEATARLLGHKNIGQLSGAYVPAHVIDQAARSRGMEALLAGLATGAASPAPSLAAAPQSP